MYIEYGKLTLIFGSKKRTTMKDLIPWLEAYNLSTSGRRKDAVHRLQEFSEDKEAWKS